MRRAFDGGLPEVPAVIYPGNEPSKQVARRIGMEYVGRTSRYCNVEGTCSAPWFNGTQLNQIFDPVPAIGTITV